MSTASASIDSTGTGLTLPDERYQEHRMVVDRRANVTELWKAWWERNGGGG